LYGIKRIEYDYNLLIEEFNKYAQTIETDPKEAFEHLYQYYQMCQGYPNLVNKLWRKVCEIYPYDNVETNCLATRQLQFYPYGIALLLSLFTGHFVIQHDGHYFSTKKIYEYLPDAWIGQLRDSNDHCLRFFGNSGVTACRRRYLLSSAKQAHSKLAKTLCSLHETCRGDSNPDKVWKEILSIYALTRDHYTNILIPELIIRARELNDYSVLFSVYFKRFIIDDGKNITDTTGTTYTFFDILKDGNRTVKSLLCGFDELSPVLSKSAST